MGKRIGFWLPHLCILGMMLPLSGAFLVQLVTGEFPCPLCVLQRMAMLLVALGPAYVILSARQGEVTVADCATGHGLSVLAAIVGACISARQVLLHVIPPDRGYGEPVFGIHLYTWALLIFAMVGIVSGLSLTFIHQLAPGPVRFGWPSKAIVGLLGVMVLANAVAIFFEEGFHLYLPDEPMRYQLLDDLGLR